MGAAQCRCSSEAGNLRFAAERLEELQDEALHVVDQDTKNEGASAGSNAGCEVLEEEKSNCDRGNTDAYEEPKEREDIKPAPIQRAALDPKLTRGHSTLVTATGPSEDTDEVPPSMSQQPRRLASLPDLAGTVAPLERLQRSGDQVRAVVRLHRILRAGPALDAGPVKCAISVEMLNEFSERAREAMGAEEYGRASVRAVCSAIIRPTCEQSGKAYARLLNGDVPLAAQVFVCHSWDANFAEFVASINHTFRHWPRKPNLWVCTFALMQTRRHTSVKRPQDAPFAAALKAANAILVVRNREVDVYSRLWPVWEIYLAKKMGLLDKRGGLLVAGPDIFPDNAVDVKLAQTSHAEDREALTQAILEEEGGYAEVCRVVAEVKASGQRKPGS